MSTVIDKTDELFHMTNLSPASTGLPMVIWVGPRYGARHDVRIKVMQAHGERMDIGNVAVVGVLSRPHVFAGQLSTDDLRSSANGSRSTKRRSSITGTN